MSALRGRTGLVSNWRIRIEMRQRLFVGVMLLAALAVPRPAHAQLKLAYVDVQRALNECDAGRKAKSEFQGKIQALDSKLQRQQHEVESLKDDIESVGCWMQPDQRQNLQDQYVRKAKELDRNLKDAREDLQRQDNEITAKILHDLAVIIRNLGEQANYTLVMEKGSILWGAPNLDITDQVIRAYNNTHGAIGTLGDGGTKYAAPAAPVAPQSAVAPPPVAGASAPSDFGSSATKRSTISR